MKLLFIDACPRNRNVSRSYRLGKAFLDEYLRLHPDWEMTEYRLDDMDLKPLTEKTEAARSALTGAGLLDDPAFQPAKDFAAADMLVVCAPYWDFAFPASLKTFIENICVYGITFVYDEHGPVGLCRAKRLVYLTTAGSPIGEDNWGGDYLKAVTGKLLGVREFHQITAEGLDILGADPESILQSAVCRAKALAAQL